MIFINKLKARRNLKKLTNKEAKKYLYLNWSFKKRKKFCKNIQKAYKSDHQSIIKDSDDPSISNINLSNPNKLLQIKYPRCLRNIYSIIINCYRYKSTSNYKNIKLFKTLFGFSSTDLSNNQCATFLNKPKEAKKHINHYILGNNSNASVTLVSTNNVPGQKLQDISDCGLIVSKSLDGIKAQAIKNKYFAVIGIRYGKDEYIGTYLSH